jgi:hypothetical protein
VPGTRLERFAPGVVGTDAIDVRGSGRELPHSLVTAISGIPATVTSSSPSEARTAAGVNVIETVYFDYGTQPYWS